MIYDESMTRCDEVGNGVVSMCKGGGGETGRQQRGARWDCDDGVLTCCLLGTSHCER